MFLQRSGRLDVFTNTRFTRAVWDRPTHLRQRLADGCLAYIDIVLSDALSAGRRCYWTRGPMSCMREAIALRSGDGSGRFAKTKQVVMEEISSHVRRQWRGALIWGGDDHFQHAYLFGTLLSCHLSSFTSWPLSCIGFLSTLGNTRIIARSSSALRRLQCSRPSRTWA